MKKAVPIAVLVVGIVISGFFLLELISGLNQEQHMVLVCSGIMIMIGMMIVSICMIQMQK